MDAGSLFQMERLFTLLSSVSLVVTAAVAALSFVGLFSLRPAHPGLPGAALAHFFLLLRNVVVCALSALWLVFLKNLQWFAWGADSSMAAELSLMCCQILFSLVWLFVLWPWRAHYDPIAERLNTPDSGK